LSYSYVKHEMHSKYRRYNMMYDSRDDASHRRLIGSI
jgi:hypothetical protein